MSPFDNNIDDNHGNLATNGDIKNIILGWLFLVYGVVVECLYLNYVIFAAAKVGLRNR